MAVTYVESTGVSRVYFEQTASNFAFINRSTGSPIVDVPTTSLTASHDYFLIEAMRDPPSGTYCLFANGFYAPGTIAGTWYFTNVVLPQRLTETISWAVVEWTDVNGNQIPDSADTFTIIASG
jgi:hypothetical protein